MPETNFTPVSAQGYDEVAGVVTTEVKNMTITPADRLRVDIAAVPGAPIPVIGKTVEIVVEEENQAVLATNRIPDPTPEFGPKLWNADSSIKHFTISAQIGSGGGDIMILYRVDSGAEKVCEVIPLAPGQMLNKIIVPTRGRYRVYYYANVDSTGVDLNVILHPQT